MNDNTKQLDAFATDFFKEVKLQFRTTDINVIGNIVELPVNADLVKTCLMFTRMYIDKYHKEIERDSLNDALVKMLKPLLVTDSVKVLSTKEQYNKAIHDVLNLIK